MNEQAATVSLTDKLIIGVTGNIATGKSAITRQAYENGALVIDADQIVHELMDSNANMQAAIALAFGSDVRRPDGRINRRVLGELVFNDDNALRDLEEMVHPVVQLEIGQRIKDTDKSIVFLEVIKLLEGPLADICHQVWVTRCPKQRQLERLIICRGLDAETATHRIELQTPQEEKVAQADVVIDTAGLMRETEAQFQMAWSRLPDPATLDPVAIQVPAESADVAPAVESDAKKEPEPAPVKLKKPIPDALKKKLGRSIPKKPVSPPKPDLETAVETKSEPEPPSPAPKKPKVSTDDNEVEVRRARPSDIPSILLLIHRATNGAVKLKRSDLLLALGERSYFIGQVGTEISTVVGWNIENLVSRIVEMYFYPIEAIETTGAAILDSIEESADRHICEVMVAFFADDVPDSVRELYKAKGFGPADLKKMPAAWRSAIKESQPEDTTFVIKVLRERVTHPM